MGAAPGSASGGGERVVTEPLSCPSCGSAVPLGSGDHIECPYCSARVEIPESYRELRDTRRQAARDHAELQAAFERLGRPPGPLLRFLAGVGKVFLAPFEALVGLLGDGSFMILLMVGLFLVLYATELFSHWVAPHFGVDVVDVLGPALTYGITGLLFAIVIFMPSMTVTARKTYTGVRAALRKSLAARLPEHAGGPSCCRNCGAPLDVPPDAVGVRCVYCQTDNLVALPAEWLTEATQQEVGQHADAIAALGELDKARKSATGTVQKGLVMSALGIAVMAGGGMLGVHLDYSIPPPPSWLAAVSPRRLVEVHGGTRIVVDQPGKAHCQGNKDCKLLYYAALHDGEVMSLESPDVPSGTQAKVFTPTTYPDLALGRFLAWKLSPDGDYRAVFKAPYTGFFAIRLTLPDPPPPAPTLIWHVGRTAPPSGEPPPPAVTRLVVPAVDKDAINRVAFSPDGRFIAAASSDFKTRILDARTGNVQRVLEGHKREVYDAAWRPGGRQLATASVDGTVRIWNATTGKAEKVLHANKGAVESLAWSPDGKLLASGSDDGHVRLFDATREFAQLTSAPAPEKNHVTWVAFDPKSPALAYDGPDVDASLWSTSPGHVSHSLPGSGLWLAFGSRGRLLAVPDGDKVLELWNISGWPENSARQGKGKPRSAGMLVVDPSLVFGVFAPTGSVLALDVGSRTIELWSAERRQQLSTLAKLDGEIASLDFSPDGRQLAAGMSDGSIVLFRLADGASWSSHGGRRPVRP